ncbi:MAG TPA: NlpC/P60 family protein [Gaiellaceae bacterium]|jgi:cell wall-associated NlpC family hydrolase
MGRRLLVAFAVVPVLFCAAAATAGTSKPAQSWAAPQIKLVTTAGLFDASTIASFHPDDALTAQALEDLSFELKQRLTEAEPPTEPLIPTDPTTTTTTTPTTTATTTIVGTTTTAPTVTTTPTVTIPYAPKQVANPTKPVTMTQLDQRLVQALELGKAATEFAHGAKFAGLKVPARFGSEVVARLLGLRLNHPASLDSLELLPNSSATRAEAAYSAAQILDFQGWEMPAVQQLADTFALPSDLTDWQKSILTTAFARIGMPYIWGGTSDGPETEFGVSSRGGYDCSGFVWRVYKLQSYPNEGDLASVLQGRTTYQMSGEIPKAKRITLANLEPADVIFFGDKGPKSQPSQVGHMGIYVGNGWFVHSSEYGVALAQLTGWYAKEFAWARRPLAEAGLE